ncbi:MAG: hypothetical protein ABI586_03710 [Candidatus Nanopelagicales bacterium]
MTLAQEARTASHSASLMQLARLLPKLVHWIPVATTVAAVIAVLAWRFDTLDDPTEGMIVMRVVAVLAALGVTFLFDDPSRNVTAPSVVTQRWRVGLRLLLAFAVCVAIVTLAGVVVATQSELTGFWLGFALEAATLIALGAVMALLLQNHFGTAEPGHVVAVGLVMSVMFILVMSARWPMFAMPDGEWTGAHQRWGMLAGLIFAAVIYELRDPASMHLIRMPRR